MGKGATRSGGGCYERYHCSKAVDVVFYQGFVMVRIISTTSQFSVPGTEILLL
jgi:hypothetical protein